MTMKSTDHERQAPVTPQSARLRNQFSVEAFGGGILKLADIDGDGEPELLILQSAGQLRCAFYTAPRLGLDECDRALYCLTAVRLDGTVLWQDGTPYDRPGIPFSSHGGSQMVAVDDIDGDGQTEVLIIRNEHLVILEGRTGKEQASVALPADNYATINTAQFGPPEKGRQILVKVNDQAYEPWEYSNPTIVYNADLSVYREPFGIRGAGHNMIARDFNGDGRDELLIGYSLLDHELNEIWSIDFGPDFDYVKEHADEIALAEVNDDGEMEIRYSGSKDFVASDLQGNLLWSTEAGHSQNSVQGPWGPGGEVRIIMNEKNQGLNGISTTGEHLWNRTDINGYARRDVCWARGDGQTHWVIFQAQRKPTLDLPYESDPAWSRDLWPRLMDGDGQLYDVFPWDESYTLPQGTIRCHRSYDAGYVYQTIVADLDGDGLDEVLVISRQWVWIFESPEAGE
jgi:hypothetical protein